jgi:hypothetical protein
MQSDGQPGSSIILAAEEYMQSLMQELPPENCPLRSEILKKIASCGRVIAVIRRAMERRPLDVQEIQMRSATVH